MTHRSKFVINFSRGFFHGHFILLLFFLLSHFDSCTCMGTIWNRCTNMCRSDFFQPNMAAKRVPFKVSSITGKRNCWTAAKRWPNGKRTEQMNCYGRAHPSPKNRSLRPARKMAWAICFDIALREISRSHFVFIRRVIAIASR